VATLVVIVAAFACNRGPSQHAPAAKPRGAEVASWLFATRGVLMSWVDGKISPETAQKNLEATLAMLEREGATPNADPRLAGGITKARALIESARKSVRSDDKAATIDVAATLSDIGHSIEDIGAK
jgi:hypothetical protein